MKSSNPVFAPAKFVYETLRNIKSIRWTKFWYAMIAVIPTVIGLFWGLHIDRINDDASKTWDETPAQVVSLSNQPVEKYSAYRQATLRFLVNGTPHRIHDDVLWYEYSKLPAPTTVWVRTGQGMSYDVRVLEPGDGSWSGQAWMLMAGMGTIAGLLFMTYMGMYIDKRDKEEDRRKNEARRLELEGEA